MNGPFIFWDLRNDELEILGEDGEFYFYGEDEVAISHGDENGRYWCRLEKLIDTTPLNEPDRFEILNPNTGEWTNYFDSEESLIVKVQKLAGVKDYKDIG